MFLRMATKSFLKIIKKLKNRDMLVCCANGIFIFCKRAQREKTIPEMLFMWKNYFPEPHPIYVDEEN